MSGLAKKLVIFAAVDGLFLQPTGQRLSISDQSVGVKIEYGTNKITKASREADEASSGLESHGIVGEWRRQRSQAWCRVTDYR